MFDTDKEKFDRALRKAVEEDHFIEVIKTKYGVTRPLTRQLLNQFGIHSPRIYEELRRLGYKVSPTEV